MWKRILVLTMTIVLLACAALAAQAPGREIVPSADFAIAQYSGQVVR